MQSFRQPPGMSPYLGGVSEDRAHSQDRNFVEVFLLEKLLCPIGGLSY